MVVVDSEHHAKGQDMETCATMRLWCFHCEGMVEEATVHSIESEKDKVYCEFTCNECGNRQEVDYVKRPTPIR